MAVWICPECHRPFGRAGQSHLCIPGTTVDEWFADEPDEHRAIHDRIAELRGRADHLALTMGLPASYEHERFSRRTAGSGGRTWFGLPLRRPEEVDDQVRDWLTTAWDLAD